VKRRGAAGEHPAKAGPPATGPRRWVEGITGRNSSAPMSAGSGGQVPLPVFHFSIGPIHSLLETVGRHPFSRPCKIFADSWFLRLHNNSYFSIVFNIIGSDRNFKDIERWRGIVVSSISAIKLKRSVKSAKRTGLTSDF
jgi:hypothetical protein